MSRPETSHACTRARSAGPRNPLSKRKPKVATKQLKKLNVKMSFSTIWSLSRISPCALRPKTGSSKRKITRSDRSLRSKRLIVSTSSSSSSWSRKRTQSTSKKSKSSKRSSKLLRKLVRSSRSTWTTSRSPSFLTILERLSSAASPLLSETQQLLQR